MNTASIIFYTIDLAAFGAAFWFIWRADRRMRGHANLRRQQVEAGILRLEHYANTGETRR